MQQNTQNVTLAQFRCLHRYCTAQTMIVLLHYPKPMLEPRFLLKAGPRLYPL